MSVYTNLVDNHRSLDEMSEEMLNKPRRGAQLIINSKVPFHPQDHDKKVRREIANSNERRRMQSINTGFEALKSMLPTQEGEKLSKAAILQLTTKYIQHLVMENRRLQNQICQFQKQDSSLCAATTATTQVTHESTILQDSKKRKIQDANGSVYIGYFQPSQQQPGPTQILVTSKPEFDQQYALEPPIVSTTTPNVTQSTPLDSLMMAIEQIEGKNRCSPPSPVMDNLRPMISPFTPQFVSSSSSTEQSACSSFTELERPCSRRAIPHKYLHRPQVIHANSSQ